MVLPDTLQSSLEEILKEIEIEDLKKSSFELSSHYRSHKALQNEKERIAYLAARLPATYHALLKVFKELSFTPNSILDIGAGPGAVWFVAREMWGNVNLTAIEKDPIFISLAKRLGSKALFIEKDVKACSDFEAHDLVCFSYSYGEILDPGVLLKAWQSAKKALLVLEPGTPRGYENILKAREMLIKEGGTVVAPCPHSNACPLGSSDWCHFAARVERSFYHRKAKEAKLPFEDEKYSYVILSKETMFHSKERILKSPLKKSGHVHLYLCGNQGLKTKTLSKKNKEAYKIARKSEWGDTL